MSDYYPDIDAAVSTLPLFRKTDPPTSVAAGERARATFVTGQARAVLEALRAGPAFVKLAAGPAGKVRYERREVERWMKDPVSYQARRSE